MSTQPHLEMLMSVALLERKAALLAADDMTLGHLAAELMGRDLVDFDCMTKSPPDEFCFYKESDWQPTKDLNQAYETLRFVRERGFKYTAAEYPRRELDICHGLVVNRNRGMFVWEKEAGGHGRALVILSILGLLHGRVG